MVSALDSTIDGERDGLSRHTADDRFDAFISYRRKDSAGVAAWLRSRLTQYRPPQALLRRLTPKQKDVFAHSRQFFLDTAYQVANEDFWVNNIEPALRASRYLIVLASAGAFERLADGGENWVEREIRTFVELHGDPSRIILVLPPSGDLQRLPASLAGLSERWDWVDLRAFQAAPWRWLSLRRVQSLETELLKVVARLFEVPRWLIPELTREETRRRARLWTTAATVIGLVVSGVAVAAAVAYQQSQLSQLARALAIINTAQRLSDSGDHASAALVALEALPQRSAWLPGPDVPEAQAALFRSLTELRERGVLRGHDGTISELRFTGDGRRVISASRDKTIRVWDAETATELRKLDLDAKPLAVSRLGGTDGPGMAVLDDGKVVEFHTDSSVVRVSATLPAGPWQAAYMSTGDDRVALIGKDEQAGGTSWRVLLADVRSGSVVLDHKLPIEASAFVWSPVEAVAMIGLVDGQILRVGRDNDSAPAPFYKLGKSIRSLAFSGDGRRLLAADADGVQVWYGLAGAPLVSLPRGRSSILRATISGNSELVAVGRWDNCVELWDVTHQRLRHLLNTPCRRDGDYPLQPNMLSFSADASELISASDDRKAVVWNTTNGHPSLVFAGHGDRLERAISDDGGKRFATASSGVISDRHDIHLWSREAVLAPGVLDHGAKVSIDFVAVSPDERLVATATDTGTTRVWLLSTGVEVAHFELGRKPTVLSFVAGTNALLIAGEGRLVLWDLVNQRNLVDLGDVSTAIESWSLSSGSAPRVAFGAQTGGLRVLDLTTGQAFDIAAANDFGSIRVATIRPDAQQIAYADERRIAIWDAATATTVHRLQLDAGDVRDVQWSPDGRTLFITTSNDSLMIWRVGEEKPRLVQPEAAFAGTLRFDTAGAVALTRTGSSVHTYDVLSGRHLAELSGETVYAVHAHQGSLQDARFSPDGRYVVTASYDRTAKIWEASSGRHVRTLSGHGDFVRSAQYTVDGKRIVTSAVITENSVDTDQQVGVSEAKVIVWDAASGKPVALISGEDQSVSGVALTADGRRLITASFVFGEVTRSFVWPLLRNSAEITAFACTSLPRRLTPDQRRVLLGAEFSARD